MMIWWRRCGSRPGSRDARYALSTKFGATADEAVNLLKLVHASGLRVGLSFHVGSQCLSPGSFTEALALCGKVIKKAGVPINFLNIGGGFPAPYPGDSSVSLEQYFAAIMLGYYRLGLPSSCVLLCEPGRSLVATAGTMIAQVIVRRDKSLYINDGVFGTLQELRHPKERRPARIIRPGRKTADWTREFKVFGPTCDSDDVLGAPFVLPEDVADGDWIEIRHDGRLQPVDAYVLQRLLRQHDRGDRLNWEGPEPLTRGSRTRPVIATAIAGAGVLLWATDLMTVVGEVSIASDTEPSCGARSRDPAVRSRRLDSNSDNHLRRAVQRTS